MKNRKTLWGLAVLVISNMANAQDSTKNGKLSITGSVDGYYRYNYNKPNDSGRTNNFTSFTNSQNSFELGMASLKADYTIGKVEAVAIYFRSNLSLLKKYVYTFS
jgi:hypothetical protein